MTDYWKSGERHFCTFCKCWLAGNKISIDLHERGNHHKNMVKAKLDQVRKANAEKDRQDKQFSQTLGQIERAANESFRRDMVANSQYNQTNAASTSDVNLPSKLKRPANEPVQIQMKKPKFIIKTPSTKPVFEPVETPTESKTEIEKSTTLKDDQKGTWYESKTETKESFYWNDTTGESTWTPPEVYLSIEEQRAKGLKV